MSVIEETRQVIQDFPTPEMRAIKARLEALEKLVDTRVDTRVDSLQKHVDTRVDPLERLVAMALDVSQVKAGLAKLESSRLH